MYWKLCQQNTCSSRASAKFLRKAREENSKQAELEKKKVQKEAEMDKAKGISLRKKAVE
ncbi:hypothetical protein RND71_026527 [Anisodus tanguticus]|uniref:Uncharacterized protein n=1 Tax=Anisodus tanguticus TaxID=243964 RepID=A0AAE1RP26_9SOLA|nr:hypothetical protein RND71_026527 [Anisodus tanguticus]